MRDDRIAVALVGALITIVPCRPVVARAQPSARLDVAAGHRYMRHGLTRATGVLLQSSAAAGFQVRRLTIEAGAVNHCEIARGNVTQTAGRDRCAGENDFWGGVGFDLGLLRLRSGVVRLDVPIIPEGSYPATTELYTSLSIVSSPFNPTFETWWDIDEVRGAFLRLSARFPILGWPFEPFIFPVIDTEVGVNIGQGPSSIRLPERSNYEARGVTHAAIGLTVSIKHAGVLSVLGGAKLQYNFDDRVRIISPGTSQDFVAWAWLGSALFIGRESRSH